MARSPSEMQRIHKENIEQRNREYRKMEQSRVTIEQQYAMNEIIKTIKNRRLPKGEKQRLLNEVRNIAARNGFDVPGYNSSEF